MKKLILIAILVGAGWYGNLWYQQHSPTLLSDFSSSPPNMETKCIAKNGSAIYGKVPAGVVCDRIEKVTGSLTIVDSKTFFGGGQESPKRHGEASGFKCDGRTRCPQMRSCGEAMFFLSKCPNVEMDGDLDGIPCEQQWCK